MDRPLAARVLGRIPAPLYRPLRNARTAALWLAEPFDLAHRWLTGRRHLPPLWIRRHVGTAASYERSPAEMATALALLGLVREDARVLDVGCGSGLMAFEFQRMLGPAGRYVGFDVHAPSIRWARRHFAGDPRLAFELARLATPYSPRFRDPVTRYAFPAADGTVDLVLAKSIFTQLFEADTVHYLAEVRRVLAPGGRALITALLVGDVGPATPRAPTYDFPHGGPHFWYAVVTNPHTVVAVDRAHFLELLTAAGLRVLAVHDGYWRGLRIAPNAQDLIVVAPA